jgi:hypothetical protein
MIVSHACREHARVGSVVIVDAHIDDHRGVVRPDEPVELSNIDGIWHGASLPPMEVRRRDTSAEASRGDRSQPLAAKIIKTAAAVNAQA